VPGVCSEIAIPLHVGGDVVGVLNVDALRPLTAADVAGITWAAGILEQRLRTVGCGPEADSILQRLGRSASLLARASSAEELGQVATVSSIRLTGFDSACMWLAEDGQYAPVASCGPDGSVLAGVDQDALQDLRNLVQEMAACYTTGPALDLGSGATHMLKRAGVRALVAAPIRDTSQLLGMLVVTRRHGAVTAPDAVDITELICQHAASRLAALRRMAELEALVTSDILTGLANRARLDLLLDDPAICRQARWLAVIDVDRFKQVNDTFGHAVGDEVLRAVGALLTAVPGGCEVLRLGGDEFAILLTPAKESAAVNCCKQILKTAETIFKPYGAGLSIGLASTQRADGLDGALIDADKALYQRKARGGGGVTLWRPATPARPSFIPRQARTVSTVSPTGGDSTCADTERPPVAGVPKIGPRQACQSG
jgi:diguanylate cyclase (GGDEF)-like protein